jgi:orotate phosphoribosyltransferase
VNLETNVHPEPVQSLLAAVRSEHGHFVYESGHHGDFWLDLDPMLKNKKRVKRWAEEIARLSVSIRADYVAGPETGGSMLAELVAEARGIDHFPVERAVTESGEVRYGVPPSHRHEVAGKRIFLVDDAINAGSAMRASVADLRAHDAEPTGLGALLVLGAAAPILAREEGIPLVRLAELGRRMWPPEECPLCRDGGAPREFRR